VEGPDLLHKVVCYHDHSGMDRVQEDSHESGTPPRNHGEVVDSRRSVRGLWVGNDRIYHGLHNIHVEVGFYHGKHHGGDYSHVEVHDDHSRQQGMVGGLETWSDLDHHVGCQAASRGSQKVLG
jgi:hypothetical protein